MDVSNSRNSTKKQKSFFGKCSLCTNEIELRFSHIIPNLFFKRTKDPSQAVYFTTDGIGDIRNGQESWQEYLLCPECDNKFGVYEKYINNMLYFPEKVNVKIHESTYKIGFTGIDFNILKYFQLSVLWRASISTHKRYSMINLTLQQNEYLRKFLNHEIDCPYGRYWCDMIMHENLNKWIPSKGDIIIPPMTQIINGDVKLLFVFGGYAWVFQFKKFLRQTEKRQLKRGRLFINKQDITEMGAISSLLEKAESQGLFDKDL